jgi:hypothetical protein
MINPVLVFEDNTVEIFRANTARACRMIGDEAQFMIPFDGRKQGLAVHRFLFEFYSRKIQDCGHDIDVPNDLVHEPGIPIPREFHN